MAIVKTSDRSLWETCLTALITRRINDLSQTHSDLFDDIRHQARQQAVTELGLVELEGAAAQLQKERAALDLGQRRIEREQLAVLRGCTPAEIPDADLSIARQSVVRAIETHADACEPLLLAECAPGRECLELNEERERLLETVLLATTAAQLKELWQRLTARLDEPATPLQRHALGLTETDDK
jgi:hypothetical protein